jgi:hypothetical protein
MTEAEYRDRADQFEKEAIAAPNSEIRARLERVAQYWRELERIAKWRTRDLNP